MSRELAHRKADNGRVEISLDWDNQTGELTLTIADEDGTHTTGVHPTEAMEALKHPYAYEANHRK